MRCGSLAVPPALSWYSLGSRDEGRGSRVEGRGSRVRDEAYPGLDDCVTCPFGKYSLQAPSYPDVMSVKVGSTATERCLLCPGTPRAPRTNVLSCRLLCRACYAAMPSRYGAMLP
eukprot:2864382-Rhodomonas_salina.1